MKRVLSLSCAVVVVCLLVSGAVADSSEEQVDCCVGMRGDMNYDGKEEPDLVDLVYLVDFLFSGGLPPLCRTEGDFNGDGSIDPNPSDLAAMVDYLYAGGDGPAGCVTLGVQSKLLTIKALPQPFLSITNRPLATKGVPIDWTAGYSLDPGQPVAFRARWRIYGPYTDNEASFLRSNIFTEVYETYDGRVFDKGDTIWVCRDSILAEYDPDAEPCSKVIISDSTPTSLYGGLVPHFDVEGSNFKGLYYDRVAVSSGTVDDPWIFEMSDTAIGLFNSVFDDTTWEGNFILWLQAADKYGNYEVTGSFAEFRAVNAVFEHDIQVIDYTLQSGNRAIVVPERATIQQYWDDVLQRVRSETPFSIDRDYLLRAGKVPPVPLTDLLSHKVNIVFTDGTMNSSQIHKDGGVRRAIEAGVPIWFVQSGVFSTTLNTEYRRAAMPSPWNEYLGVDSLIYDGWACSALGGVELVDTADCPGGRIEDFDGADAVQADWPDVVVDTSLLHGNYTWGSFGLLDTAFAWEPYYTDPPIGAMPAVRVIVPSDNAEVLYTYSSIYGGSHPNGGDCSFEGQPVAVRVSDPVVRTAFYTFTPLSSDSFETDEYVRRMLEWLFVPWNE